MSIVNNLYQSVRLASTSVSAMTFLYSQKNLLAIAYENGVVVIVNTHTRDIVGNIQVRNKATARIIQCHPSLSRLLIVTDDGAVSMWDFSTCQCLQSMQCEEPIADARYELGGDVIAITLESSGAYLYGSDSCQLIVHLTLPDSERPPRWTAYSSSLVSVASERANERVNVVNGKKQSSAAPSKLLNVLLAADNCMVYSWCVDVTESHDGSAGVAVNLGTTSTSTMKLTRTPVKAHLVGIVELPIKLRMVVAMATVNNHSQCPPRVVLLSVDGSMVMVDIDGFREKSVGYWTVVADLPVSLLHGTVNVSFAPVAVGRPLQGSVLSAAGRLDVCNDYLVLVGADGAARLVDNNVVVGSGALCGSMLRSRTPYLGGGGGGEQFAPVPPPRSQSTQRYVEGRGVVGQPVAAQQAPLQQFPSNNTQSQSAPTPMSGRGTEDFYLPDEPEEEQVISEKTTAASKARQWTGKAGADKTASATAKQQKAKEGIKGYQRRTSSSNSTVKMKASANKAAAGGQQVHSFVGHSRAAALSSRDLLSTPLFELATLTPAEKQVNVQKLKTFLSLNGEFPARYRPLIWRFLLKLPENTNAFADLVQRGVHPRYENLYDLYPIEARKIFVRLQNLCSQLAHWAPILGDAPYLPSIAFPFVLLFGSDELAALETCMSILMWWGYSWHATHPNPPVHVLDSLDHLLKFHDTKLYYHLTALKVAPGVLCWNMLSTLFTEVLSRSNWFKLMDFLFAHFDNNGYILLVPIALLRELKVSLFTADTDSQVNAYCRSQQGVAMETLIKHLQELLGNTPAKYFAAMATKHVDKHRFQQGTSAHVIDAVDMDEIDEARQNLALSAGSPMFPLPQIRYPAYDGFPKHVLDLQIKERNSVLALGQEVTRREGVLTLLGKKLEEVESDHLAWMSRHQSASEAELRHQKEVMDRERTHLRELHRIEEDISLQRIRALNALETAAKEEMQLMDRAAEDSKMLLLEGEAHMREKMEITLSLQKHRELAEQAEIATQEKIRRLRLRRARDDWVKGMSGTLKGQEEELAARDAIINEKWRRQDDEMRLQRELRVSQSKALEDNDAMSRLQEDMALRMHRLQLEREAKIIEIERARAIRLAKEQAEEALEAQQRASLILRKQEVLSSTEQANLMTMRSAQEAEEKMMQTVTRIREESSRLIDAERVHALRNSKVRQDARQAQLRKEWAEKSNEQLQAVLSAEGELQEQMLRLQRASLRSEAEANYARVNMEEVFSSRGQGDELRDARKDMESIGDRVLQQQRERFQEMQQYLQSQSEQQLSTRPSAAQHSSAGSSGDLEGQQVSEFRRLQGELFIDNNSNTGPSWSRSMAPIPVPSTGAGIGYGVQATTTRDKGRRDRDGRSSHRQDRGSSEEPQYAQDVVLDSGSSESEEDSSSALKGSAFLNVYRPPESKPRYAAAAAAGLKDDLNNYASSDSELSTHPIDKIPVEDSMKIAARALLVNNSDEDDEDNLGAGAGSTHWDSAAMRYSDQRNAHIASARNTIAAVDSGYGKSAPRSRNPVRNSADLKKLADASLRSLQETRELNRYELAEESQADQVRQRAKERAGRSAGSTQLQHQQTSGSTTRVTTTTTSTSRSATQSSTSGRSRYAGSKEVDVTVDSDSALWAFADE